MTTAQVVETSVTVNNNSPTQDYVHPDNQTQPSFVLILIWYFFKAAIPNLVEPDKGYEWQQTSKLKKSAAFYVGSSPTEHNPLFFNH